jgi:hypothetical protein
MKRNLRKILPQVAQQWVMLQLIWVVLTLWQVVPILWQEA